MERTNLEVIADSVDEAVEQGLAQLGLPKDSVNVEIVDPGSRGFLGIGGRQARVRLTVRQEGEAAAEPQSAARGKPKPAATSTQPGAGVATPAGGDELLETTSATVHTLLSKMKVDAEITTAYGESDDDGDVPVLVDIRGEDLSVLIGRRSETLNALQYIAGLIVSKQAGRYVQLVLDVEGFRNRREKQLRQLARRMAEQAVSTGKRQVLEPMSAADRRVIHIELREDTSVTTESIGADPNRKVTIVPR
jgi:spoIIIJ-associated protein